MTSRRAVPVEVVVADAGPLVSLAACDRLALLEVFGRPVRVPDVVRAECLRFPDRVGAETLARWFASPGAGVRVMPTPLLRA